MKTKNATTFTIHVYDDASTDYSLVQLQLWYGKDAVVHRNEQGRGASAQIARALFDFSRSTADAIMMADSDLLFGPLWLHTLTRAWPKSSGWVAPTPRNFTTARSFPLSEFIGTTAKIERSLRLAGAGNAGSVLAKSLVQDGLSNVPHCGSNQTKCNNMHKLFDLRLSRFLANSGVCMTVVCMPWYHLGFRTGIHVGLRLGSD